MCVSIKAPSPPPAPEPISSPPPSVSNATTSQDAPTVAKKRDTSGTDISGRSTNMASSSTRKRLGRGSLRIPLTSSGLSGSGLNFPTA